MLINSFLDYLNLERNYSKLTIVAYEKDLNGFLTHCKNEFEIEDLATVNYAQIRSWISFLVTNGISNATINRKISSLKSFYKFLQKIGQIKTNPLAKHRALKTVKKVQVPFTNKEINAVIDVFDGDLDYTSIRNKLIVELFYSTGMRRAELIHLKSSDVDLNTASLKVIGKRNKERIIPLIPSVIETLKSYLSERKKYYLMKTIYF